MTDPTFIPEISERRATALRLLDKATELADDGLYEAAETMLGISQEQMAHDTLVRQESRVEEIKGFVQTQMLAANDPEGPHGPGCNCG